MLYDVIDGCDGFYLPHAETASRSIMNVPFKLADVSREEAFLKGAAACGLVELKGHRSVGGFRASIYNAMPEAGVQALRDYMLDFAQKS
jgi:phosphoserine aminotransferase